MRLLNTLISGLVFTLLFASPAFAAENAAASGDGTSALAAGIAIAIAVLGGTFGQAKATSSALDAIGRNPGASGQLFTPMIIGLVLIESLVIYALVIAMKLVGIF